jgi:cardiolipin synthase (CMP-forming)
VNLANRVTVLRIILVPFFVGLILKFNQTSLAQGQVYRWLAVGLFCVAALSDALDGYMARRRNQITELGTILDPIADKLLLLSAVLILSIPGHLERMPLWFVVTVFSRDIIIVLGALLLHYLMGRVTIAPNPLGKLTTVAQMTAILWILLGLDQAYIVWRIAGFLTVGSGITYILTGSKQFSEVPPPPR